MVASGMACGFGWLRHNATNKLIEKFGNYWNFLEL